MVEVVDLEEDTVGGQEVFFQSLLQEGHDDHEFTSPPVDNVSEGTLGVGALHLLSRILIHEMTDRFRNVIMSLFS